MTGRPRINFELVQESDLLDRLAQPQHRGRAWFWWADPQLSEPWFQDRLREQAATAGERYRPDLQIDLPIEEDLKALGCSTSIFEKFEQLRRGIISAGRKVSFAPSGPTELRKLHREALKSAKELVATCSRMVLQSESATTCLVPLANALTKFLREIREAEMLEHTLEYRWSKLPADAPERPKKKPPSEARSYSAQELRRKAAELESWLSSSIGETLQSRFYFLIGPAGSGKTHLFLDAARRALNDGRPAVVLFGARFGRGDLWASVCDQLGLEPLGANVLLGAMDAAAEAAAITGRRFVILIDALNETVPPNFWTTHLPALRAAISRWPHIALAVSCRDTYVEIVDEGTERGHYVRRTHPGFAGREVEATQSYFKHFGLEAPRIPLLTPEFSLPLFLRLYCESLRDSGQARAAVGHEGRVRIFQRYLEAKLGRVGRRLRPAAATFYELRRAKARASLVVDALLDEFAATGRESASVDRIEVLAATALEGSLEDAATILGALQSEGVLTLERLYFGYDTPTDGFRIVFQAFADYLILRRRLARLTDPLADADFLHWLQEDCSWGIVEAATVVLPELYGVELPDLLGPMPRSFTAWPNLANDRARRRYGRARSVFRSFIETLPYRDSAAVTDRTLELLNQNLRLVSAQELFRTIFLIAPQPENRLNSEALHRYLLQLRMPRRDAFFGIATYQELFEEASPVSLLARWASRGPYPSYDARVIELSCIPLVWLMSSPNRFMRDWVTKALVQLLRGHLDVMRKLLNRFWVVDDPYVVQRLIVIAYGALMRSDPTDAPEARKLAKRIKDLVFTRPIRADELLLDAARGAVEWAVMRKLLGNRALNEIKRPYDLAPPSNPPSEATLDKKYGFKKDLSDEESYSTIYFSLMSFGDFGRYVVESGMDHFSRYKRGEIFPDREAWEPKLVKKKWREFERSLTTKQRLELEMLAAAEESGQPLTEVVGAFHASLTKKQSELLGASWRYSPKKVRDDRYPVRRARRWVFARTLSLGWTPKLFGRTDRRIGYGQEREAHKTERWGKKYQWIAYHELLARVADNYEPSRMDSEQGPYEGLHQLIAEREIDPSLPPIEYREFSERSGEGVPTWRPSPVTIINWPPARIDFRRYHGSIDAFIDDRKSEPALSKVALVTDDGDNTWVVLDAYISQSDPEVPESWLGLQQNFALGSWFVPRGQAADLLEHLPALRRERLHDIVDTSGHTDCCYVCEIGWTPHSCYHRHADFKQVEFAGRTWKLAPTVEIYCWEGGLLDCSLSESVFAALPSTFVQARSNVLLNERGPCWLDAKVTVVFTNVGDSSDRRGRGLLVRWHWLRTFLEEHDLDLVVVSWYERRLVDKVDTRTHRFEDVVSAARIDAQMRIHLSEPNRVDRW